MALLAVCRKAQFAPAPVALKPARPVACWAQVPLSEAHQDFGLFSLKVAGASQAQQPEALMVNAGADQRSGKGKPNLPLYLMGAAKTASLD